MLAGCRWEGGHRTWQEGCGGHERPARGVQEPHCCQRLSRWGGSQGSLVLGPVSLRPQERGPRETWGKANRDNQARGAEGAGEREEGRKGSQGGPRWGGREMGPQREQPGKLGVRW